MFLFAMRPGIVADEVGGTRGTENGGWPVGDQEREIHRLTSVGHVRTGRGVLPHVGWEVPPHPPLAPSPPSPAAKGTRLMLLARLMFECPSPRVSGEKVPKADEGFVRY